MPKPKGRKTRFSSGKKGWLSCRKCIFDQIKANLAKIQPQSHQNVQKRILAKSSRSQWVKTNPHLYPGLKGGVSGFTLTGA